MTVQGAGAGDGHNTDPAGDRRGHHAAIWRGSGDAPRLGVRSAMVAFGGPPLYEGNMDAKSPRATYRHGNLKQAALKAASRLVAKGGHEALSLREVAEAVGVA